MSPVLSSWPGLACYLCRPHTVPWSVVNLVRGELAHGTIDRDAVHGGRRIGRKQLGNKIDYSQLDMQHAASAVLRASCVVDHIQLVTLISSDVFVAKYNMHSTRHVYRRKLSHKYRGRAHMVHSTTSTFWEGEECGTRPLTAWGTPPPVRTAHDDGACMGRSIGVQEQRPCSSAGRGKWPRGSLSPSHRNHCQMVDVRNVN